MPERCENRRYMVTSVDLAEEADEALAAAD
jgi:hypothetical protein